jgi:glycosyltransferase involved in cell wall biosynthesis
LAGCPVVSSDCPSGPAEILNNGQYGLLTPVNDIEQLAAAIVTTLNTVLEPQKLRQRGLEFSLERALDGYHQVFFDKPAIA